MPSRTRHRSRGAPDTVITTMTQVEAAIATLARAAIPEIARDTATVVAVAITYLHRQGLHRLAGARRQVRSKSSTILGRTSPRDQYPSYPNDGSPSYTGSSHYEYPIRTAERTIEWEPSREESTASKLKRFFGWKSDKEKPECGRQYGDVAVLPYYPHYKAAHAQYFEREIDMDLTIE
ncbi:hypothetical protein BDZ89DRAFT_1118404 [Hymenopellis radicata]|nr:hypothetical protein BDZ89DRAFT_1118404 [Hymenopellis radicata]